MSLDILDGETLDIPVNLLPSDIEGIFFAKVPTLKDGWPSGLMTELVRFK